MKGETKKSLGLIFGVYLMLAIIFGLFAYANWQRIDPKWWFDLGVATAAVFGFLIPPLGPDLKRPKVLVVLAGLFAGHMIFCIHFLARGIHVRPLFYIPIGIVEIFIAAFAVTTLGGARLEAFRNHRRQDRP